MKKIYLLIILFWKAAFPTWSQDYIFETLTVEDGLSQNSVTNIVQDPRGFIWIGTRDGLNVFNGQDFKVFRKVPFDTASLASNIIHCLLPDSTTGLFVGTKAGLQRYDLFLNRFDHIPLGEAGSSLAVRALYRDRFGILWVGTENGFFHLNYDRAHNHFVVTPFLFRSKNEEKDRERITVTGFLHDRMENFWVVTTTGAYRIPYQNKRLDNVDALLGDNQGKSTFYPGLIQSVFEHSNGDVFALGPDTLYRWNETQRAFHVILAPEHTGNNHFGNELGEGQNGQLWASHSSGLILITFSGDSILSTQSHYPPLPGVSQNRYKINYVWQDQIQKDFYWLATDLGGVIKMFSQKKKFHSLLLKDIPKLSLSNPYIRHIVVDGNRIWINVGMGLLLTYRNKKDFKFINDIFSKGYEVNSTSVSTIYKSREGILYAAIPGGLIEITSDEKEQIKSTYHPFSTSIAENCLTIEESSGQLILGFSAGRISVLDKRDLKEIRSFYLEESDSQPKPDITSLLLDNHATLWVGTTEGLYLFRDFLNEVNGHSAALHLTYNPSDTAGLIENRITALMQDSKNNIWVCTRNGLMKARETPGGISLQQIKVPALLNQVLYGILEDQHASQYWLSSNKGLFRFDPGHGTVDNFDVRDGLQGNEFNTFSFYKSDSGEMFFGGTNGVTSFFPSDIQLDTLAPLLWITSLTTSSNQQFNLLARDTQTPLRLAFSQRSFSVDFIGLDYVQPDHLKYYYTLSGSASLQHIPLGNSRQVNFSQLDPGNYTLEIFAVNSDGAMSRNHDVLRFTIRAPYWRMPWFYLLMTGIVAFLGWLMFYLRYQNKIKGLKAIEQVRKSISEDFHDELGSKLSIISMYSELSKQELNKDTAKAATYLAKVNDTASRLYENTRDLIWALNPQHDSLYDLFLQLKDFGEEMFQDTGIEFHSAGLAETWKHKNLPMRFKRHLLLIFKEGMHNALKHSGCKTVKLHIEEKDHKLIILLQDDGVGFDTTVTHKGDGLKNMARRAEHLQGKLHFISRKEGTRIWVELQENLFS